MALSYKRRVFVEAYLQTGAEQFVDGKARSSRLNATQAARVAGYAHPGTEGHRLLQIPEIQAAIEARMKEMEARTEQLIAREYDVATGDMGDFAEVFAEPNVSRMLERARALGISHLIRKVKQTMDGAVELQLYDAHQARELLGRRLGLWQDEPQKIDLSTLPPVLLNVMRASEDEIVAALDRMAEDREER